MLYPSPAPDPALRAGAGPAAQLCILCLAPGRLWGRAALPCELNSAQAPPAPGLAVTRAAQQHVSVTVQAGGQAASLLSGGQAAPTLGLPQSTDKGRVGEKSLGAQSLSQARGSRGGTIHSCWLDRQDAQRPVGCWAVPGLWGSRRGCVHQ